MSLAGTASPAGAWPSTPAARCARSSSSRLVCSRVRSQSSVYRRLYIGVCLLASVYRRWRARGTTCSTLLILWPRACRAACPRVGSGRVSMTPPRYWRQSIGVGVCLLASIPRHLPAGRARPCDNDSTARIISRTMRQTWVLHTVLLASYGGCVPTDVGPICCQYDRSQTRWQNMDRQSRTVEYGVGIGIVIECPPPSRRVLNGIYDWHHMVVVSL